MSIFVGHKPDRRHVQALYDARNNENLLDLFSHALAKAKNDLVDAEGEARIARLQGRAEALRDFLDAAEKSPEVMSRLDSQSK